MIIIIVLVLFVIGVLFVVAVAVNWLYFAEYSHQYMTQTFQLFWIVGTCLATNNDKAVDSLACCHQRNF